VTGEGVRIPERLARSTLAWHGRRGARWLEALPSRVREVTDRFDLRAVEGPFDPGGHASWCAPARTADGRDVVLKLQVPDDEVRAEAAALAGWAGRGAARLVDRDPDRWALVLERCRPGSDAAALDDPLAAAIVGATVAARLHACEVALPEAPHLGEVMASWADEVEARAAAEHRAGLDRGALAMGLEAMRTLPGSASHGAVLHGDLNPTNLLAAEREPWLAIDPKPMLGDPTWDGVRLVLQPDPGRWPDPRSVLADRLDLVAGVLGVERDHLARWCVADAVQMVTSPEGGQVDRRILGLVGRLAG
jgi:streptomycin 6-kinase